LADAVNRQYNAEVQLANIRESKNAAKVLLDWFSQAERAEGKLSEIREVEIQRAAAEAGISEEIKKQGPVYAWILSLIERVFAARRKQAEMEAMLRETSKQVDTTRIDTTNLTEAHEAYLRHRATILDVVGAMAVLEEQVVYNNKEIAKLQAIIDATGDSTGELTRQIRELTQANKQAQSSIDDLSTFASKISDVMQRAQDSLETFAKSGIGALTALADVAAMAAVMVGQGLGNAFTQMFQAIMTGESALGAFKKFLGQILIQVGEMCVSLGAVGIIMGLIPFLNATTNVPACIALIAAGAGLIAAGVALGGAGGKGSGNEPAAAAATGNNEPAAQWVNQRDVLVQQGIQDALRTNTEVIGNLNSQLNRLSREKGDVLVSRTIKTNPSIVTTPLTNRLSTSYKTSRNLGAAMLGET
jgi:hypothetical protein